MTFSELFDLGWLVNKHNSREAVICFFLYYQHHLCNSLCQGWLSLLEAVWYLFFSFFIIFGCETITMKLIFLSNCHSYQSKSQREGQNKPAPFYAAMTNISYQLLTTLVLFFIYLIVLPLLCCFYCSNVLFSEKNKRRE